MVKEKVAVEDLSVSTGKSANGTYSASAYINGQLVVTELPYKPTNQRARAELVHKYRTEK